MGSVVIISVPCRSSGVSLALLVVLEGSHAPRMLALLHYWSWVTVWLAPVAGCGA